MTISIYCRTLVENVKNDPRLLKVRDMAFKLILNDTNVFKLELPTLRGLKKTSFESRSPELLANYCDMLLRKTPLSKRLSSDETENRLKGILVVLKYILNKDVFMRYHKAHLTRRLILDLNVDSEKESNMIEGLREIGMPAGIKSRLRHLIPKIPNCLI